MKSLQKLPAWILKLDEETGVVRSIIAPMTIKTLSKRKTRYLLTSKILRTKFHRNIPKKASKYKAWKNPWAANEPIYTSSLNENIRRVKYKSMRNTRFGGVCQVTALVSARWMAGEGRASSHRHAPTSTYTLHQRHKNLNWTSRPVEQVYQTVTALN